MNLFELIDRLERGHDLADDEFAALIENTDAQVREHLHARARCA